jgi:ubiquinone/menaquinone biosynthesis C-methylase UbiE
MGDMTKLHPKEAAEQHRHDYLPAAGRDAFLPFYDLLTALLGAGKVHRTLIDQAELAAGQRVLEIGCGTGNLSVRAKRAQPGIELVGSDPDPRALARAQRKARRLTGIRFERAYAQRLPYPDASFDRVLSALMLHHLDQETKTAAAAEIARVLRPGGRLHLVDFTGQGHGIHGALSRRVVKSGHVADNVGDGIPKLLGTAGLVCTEVTTYRHPVLGQVTYYRAVRPS